MKSIIHQINELVRGWKRKRSKAAEAGKMDSKSSGVTSVLSSPESTAVGTTAVQDNGMSTPKLINHLCGFGFGFQYVFLSQSCLFM